MAFISVGGNVISYAEYTDVTQRDQRLFEANVIKIPEGSDFVDVPDFIEDLLQKSTDRINAKFKASTWWQGYQHFVGNSEYNPALLPDFDPNRVIGRQDSFTEMCVAYCMKEYLLPLIADFSTAESAEVQKMRYYDDKFNDIFQELMALADWYDANDDGVVDNSEKAWSYRTIRRSRRRNSVVKVR